jgi:hypothetical protein
MRSAQQSITLRPQDFKSPVPTGSLARECGGQCSSRHSASKPLTVVLQFDEFDSVQIVDQQVKVDWAIAPLGSGALVVPAKAQAVTAVGKPLVSLTIPASALPAASAVTVSAKLSFLGSKRASGQSQLVVPLNAAPTLKTPVTVELLGSDRRYGKAAFRVSAAGIFDDDELT